MIFLYILVKIKEAFMDLDRIKNHFEEEAKEFDIIIQKLIPNYNLMIDALVSAIPFAENSNFTLIDLGCGTGTISKTIKNLFPNANITCVDISKNMLQIAESKLNGKVKCICEDFYNFEFPQKYNLIVSSLALHHLETDSDKLMFYKKIYSALNPGGIFINIDVVLASDDKLQNTYMQKWQEYMAANVSKQEIEEKWLPSYYAEDRPTKLSTHLEMLKECNFSCIDVVFKYYNFAVYTGKK